MKRLLLLLFFIPFISLAQVPQGVGYQGVATDASGVELVNQAINIRASVLSSSATGTIEWEETHTDTTDAFGLFTLTIGQGTSTGNGAQTSFANISWGTNTHFLKIEMDVTGGTNYSFMGTNQMMSVPYALYAESAGSASPGSNSGTGGGCLIPVALSEESGNTMSFTDAMLFCDSLVEGGYDNWVMPTLEEIVFVASGGGIVPGNRSSNKLWTSNVINGQSGTFDLASFWSSISLSGGYGIHIVQGYSSQANSTKNIRCVRHESVAVSGSGSPGGSNTPSTLGSGMPTMISNESANTMHFAAAMLYCDNLSELGYSDWILPTLEQISYASSGGCVFNDLRNDSKIWTRTQAVTNSGHKNETYTINLGPNPNDVYRYEYTYLSNLFNCRCVR